MIYDFGDLLNPKWIQTFEIKNGNFLSHGMCLLSSHFDRNTNLHSISFMLFGGGKLNESFIECKLVIQTQTHQKTNVLYFKEKKIKFKFKTKCDAEDHSDFGFLPILNKKNELNIIMFGGSGIKLRKSLVIANVSKKEIHYLPSVLFYIVCVWFQISFSGFSIDIAN